MYGRPQPVPRFWKALLNTALFVLPLSLFARIFIKMNDWVWLGSAIAATLAIASLVHSRVSDDWRMSDRIALDDYTKRTRHVPSIKQFRR